MLVEETIVLSRVYRNPTTLFYHEVIIRGNEAFSRLRNFEDKAFFEWNILGIIQNKNKPRGFKKATKNENEEKRKSKRYVDCENFC